MTAGGTITGRNERRAERERERNARERSLASIAAGAEVSQAARVAAFRNTHHNGGGNAPQPAALGHHTASRATGITTVGANRPLLAPPQQTWDASAALAPRPEFAPYQGPPPAVNLDRDLDRGTVPVRRRADTVGTITGGRMMDRETSRYFPGTGTHDDVAGPSRGRRRGGEDHEMNLD